jgi:hypothetical protein
VNEVLLIFISVLVRFLHKVVTSVQEYEQDEMRRLCLPKTAWVRKEVGTRTNTA